jgi:hypothetical protein
MMPAATTLKNNRFSMSPPFYTTIFFPNNYFFTATINRLKAPIRATHFKEAWHAPAHHMKEYNHFFLPLRTIVPSSIFF